MRRADRLFHLVQLIQNRRFVTAQELAEELEVSKRTIYRDVQDLILSGVPIEGEAGVGYRLERGYKLPPLSFNSEELQALVLGMRLVQSWSDSDLGHAAKSVLNKIEEVVPDSLKCKLHDVQLFAIPPFWRGKDETDMAVIRAAISQKKKLSFHYETEFGKRSQRIVWPLGLYFWGKVWTLAAWCELRSNFRSFRPDRMEQMRVEAESFIETEEINLNAFLKNVYRGCN